MTQAVRLRYRPWTRAAVGAAALAIAFAAAVPPVAAQPASGGVNRAAPADQAAPARGNPAPAAATAARRLSPAGAVKEIVDPAEPVSGNAITGLMLVPADDAIGRDRLWAYISAPKDSAATVQKLKLTIASIDGRYYGEVPYEVPVDPALRWVALDLQLERFPLLENRSNYSKPLDEVSVLLTDEDGKRYFPVRWDRPFDARSGGAPNAPKPDDLIRVYLNTERASAFLAVGNRPVYCRDASSISGFKFNAICEVKLSDLSTPSTEVANGHVLEKIQVYRRSGVRNLLPLELEVLMQY